MTRGWFFLTATNLNEATLTVGLRLDRPAVQCVHPKSKPTEKINILRRENILINYSERVVSPLKKRLVRFRWFHPHKSKLWQGRLT